jgi:hypothetical protein
MQYLYPGYLLGLLFAATPIIIYILLRRRKQEIPWGASYLLRLTLASRRKSSLWKQYLVLAMRCAILALIAWLIAEPFKGANEESMVPALPANPMHRVILVDHSASMSVTDKDGSRKGRMRLVLNALLGSQRHADRTSLIPLISPEDPVLLAEGKQTPEAIEGIIRIFDPREGTLQLRRSLSRTVSSLTQTPDAVSEVYLLSDFPGELSSELQKIGWFAEAVKGMNIRVAAVNMTKGESPPNIGLLSLTLGSDLVIRHIPVTLYATMANYSSREAMARFEVNGEGVQAATKLVELLPGEEKKISLDVTFTRGGVQSLTASVSPSRLPSSSSASLSIEVKDELNIWLLVDPADPTKADALDEAEFLRRATSAGESPLRIEEIELVKLSVDIPDSVDVILVAGPRVITPAVQKPLSRFVRRGGGLVIFMSPKADTSFYNPNLSDLMPAKLLELARGKVSPENFWSAKARTTNELTLLTEFNGGDNGEVEAARFYNYRRSEPKEDAEVLFELEDGQPLLIHRATGRGHTYLFTSSLGISWSSMPVRRTYIPFLHRLLNMAARGRGFVRNLQPGETFVSRWPSSGTVTLISPDQKASNLETEDANSIAFVVATGMQQRGLYTIHKDDARQSFTITGNPPEADLRSLEPEEMKKLGDLLGSPIYPDWSSAVQALGPSHESDRLWPWLLLAVLAIYAIEAWFVRQL